MDINKFSNRRLPTPEELGELLERGEISPEDAAEIMAQRARRDAFKEIEKGPGGAGPFHRPGRR